MENYEAVKIITEFAKRQKKDWCCCPRCGMDSMAKNPTRNALSRAFDINVCDDCGTDEALWATVNCPTPAQKWAIAENPNLWDTPQTYYFTFGSDMKFPHQNGWVEVKAFCWNSAIDKFRQVYPDRHQNIINCAFCYDAERWAAMDPPRNWPGYKCHGVIE